MGTFFLIMVVRLFITYSKYSSLELDIKLSSHSDARRPILTNIANKRVLCKSLQKQKTIALKSLKATAASVFQVWAAGCESESGLCGASFSPRSTATGEIFKCTIHMLVAYGSECNRMSHQPFFSESLSCYLRDKKCCCLCRAARHVKSHRFARLIELHELLDCASELMIPSSKHQKRNLKVKQQRQAGFAVRIARVLMTCSTACSPVIRAYVC
jgi:hypothetical protein